MKKKAFGNFGKYDVIPPVLAFSLGDVIPPVLAFTLSWHRHVFPLDLDLSVVHNEYVINSGDNQTDQCHTVTVCPSLTRTSGEEVHVVTRLPTGAP